MYESKISDAKWITYDIPGNIGWIAFLVGLILYFTKKSKIIKNQFIFRLLLLDLLCGVATLVAIGNRRVDAAEIQEKIGSKAYLAHRARYVSLLSYTALLYRGEKSL